MVDYYSFIDVYFFVLVSQELIKVVMKCDEWTQDSAEHWLVNVCLGNCSCVALCWKRDGRTGYVSEITRYEVLTAAEAAGVERERKEKGGGKKNTERESTDVGCKGVLHSPMKMMLHRGGGGDHWCPPSEPPIPCSPCTHPYPPYWTIGRYISQAPNLFFLLWKSTCKQSS